MACQRIISDITDQTAFGSTWPALIWTDVAQEMMLVIYTLACKGQSESICKSITDNALKLLWNNTLLYTEHYSADQDSVLYIFLLGLSQTKAKGAIKGKMKYSIWCVYSRQPHSSERCLSLDSSCTERSVIFSSVRWECVCEVAFSCGILGSVVISF